MTRATCPLGEDCDLTVAYMLGRRDASDELARKAVKLALEEAATVAGQIGSMRLEALIRALDPAAIIAQARKW